jgi:hypothetical protein
MQMGAKNGANCEKSQFRSQFWRMRMPEKVGSQAPQNKAVKTIFRTAQNFP